MAKAEKITFIYCYRDRDLERVKLSLDSLADQTNRDFRVIFVDYGSGLKRAAEVEKMVNEYAFAQYCYNDTRGKVWNRSHALNTAIKLADSEFVFTSDIDMIYKPGFVDFLMQNSSENNAMFFSAIMLPEGVYPDHNKEYPRYVRSTDEAMGWALIPRKSLFELNGYDEFYCIWGKEDNDIAHRLRLTGIDVKYIKDIWMFHFYHPPVPKQKGMMPLMWYLFLTAYFRANTEKAIRNEDITWGAITKKAERDVDGMKQMLQNARKIENVLLKYFIYTLEMEFRNMRSGDFISYDVKQTNIKQLSRTKPATMARFLNSIFEKLRIPLEVRSVYERNFTHVQQIRDEFLYFITKNKLQISDYYYEVEGDSIRFCVIKS